MRGVERVESVDGTYTDLADAEGTDPAGVMARLAAAVAPARIELARLRLEDVFVRIVAEGARAATLLAGVARQPAGRRGRGSIA